MIARSFMVTETIISRLNKKFQQLKEENGNNINFILLLQNAKAFGQPCSSEVKSQQTVKGSEVRSGQGVKARCSAFCFEGESLM